MRHKPDQPLFRVGTEGNLTPEIYQAIGLVIVQWNYVEYECWSTIGDILGLDESAVRIMVSGMQARTMLGVLRNLIHERHSQHKAVFERIRPRLEKALEYRNDVAHAFYGGFGSKLPALKIQWKTRLTKAGLRHRRSTPASAHSLRRRALFIHVVQQELQRLHHDVLGYSCIPVSRGKPA